MTLYLEQLVVGTVVSLVLAGIMGVFVHPLVWWSAVAGVLCFVGVAVCVLLDVPRDHTGLQTAVLVCPVCLGMAFGAQAMLWWGL